MSLTRSRRGFDSPFKGIATGPVLQGGRWAEKIPLLPGTPTTVDRRESPLGCNQRTNAIVRPGLGVARCVGTGIERKDLNTDLQVDEGLSLLLGIRLNCLLAFPPPLPPLTDNSPVVNTPE
jgi:hypothetical protein